MLYGEYLTHTNGIMISVKEASYKAYPYFLIKTFGLNDPALIFAKF